MRKRCKYCGRFYRGTSRSIACPQPKCKAERYRDWKLEKYGPPKINKPRKCIHCGSMFVIKNRRANQRQFCYETECIDKNRKYAYSKARKITSEWRKKPKVQQSGRLCQKCLKPLPANRHFRHDLCAERTKSRTDGDYIYNYETEIAEV